MKQVCNLYLVPKPKQRFSIRNSSGQAVTEYVLILIFVITMLFAAKGFFQGIDSFINRYMGEYIACLMEYGELPALGVQATDLKNNKNGLGGGAGCNSKFDGFTLSAGRPPTGGVGQSSGRSNGSSQTSSSSTSTGRSSSSSNGQSSQSSNGGRDSSSGDAVAGGSRRGKAGSSNGNSSLQTNGGYHTADSPQALNSAKVKTIDEDESNASRRRQDSGRRDLQTRFIYDKGKYRALTGRMAEEALNKSKSVSRKPSSKFLFLTEDGFAPGPVRKTIKPYHKEAPIREEKPDDFSFGGILRWLMIAGMVIAFFILFGGQILNYSNSQD